MLNNTLVKLKLRLQLSDLIYRSNYFANLMLLLFNNNISSSFDKISLKKLINVDTAKIDIVARIPQLQLAKLLTLSKESSISEIKDLVCFSDSNLLF